MVVTLSSNDNIEENKETDKIKETNDSLNETRVQSLEKIEIKSEETTTVCIINEPPHILINSNSDPETERQTINENNIVNLSVCDKAIPVITREEIVINSIVDTGEEGGIEIDFSNRHHIVKSSDEECVIMHSSIEPDDAFKTPSETVLETLSETIYEQIDELIAKLTESKAEIDATNSNDQTA